MNGDARGWRIALVPETLINPRDERRGTLPDAMGVLEATGYGVLQLPPPGKHGLLLAVIADQVAEYAHHGYAVVAIGVRGEEGDHWRSLSPLLRHRGVAPLPRYIIRPDADTAAEGQRLATFLSGYDLPLDAQRHWRV